DRRREVGEPLGEVDRPVLGGEPGHSPDNRLREGVCATGGMHGLGTYKRKAPAKTAGAFVFAATISCLWSLAQVTEPDEAGAAPVDEGDGPAQATRARGPTARERLMPAGLQHFAERIR